MNSFAETWDLESLFRGGSDSLEFLAFLQQLEADIAGLKQMIMGGKSAEAGWWSAVFTDVQGLLARIKQAGAFVSCLVAQDVKDEKAKLLRGRINQISAGFGAVMTQVDAQILQETDWQTVIRDSGLEAIQFPLVEMQKRARHKMRPELESLAAELAVDGYQAWGNFYQTLVGRMQIPLSSAGKMVQLSVGQAENQMMGAGRTVRATVFRDYEEEWSSQAELFATVLNHLAGFRLNLYRRRGWDSVLQEPLDLNRMSRDTLDAMWDAIDRNKEKFAAYLDRKAKLLGLDRLSWFDVAAPLSSASSTLSYEEGAAFILEQFSSFSPKMADFASQAFAKRWIEAEDRARKSPGGFHTGFPLNKESRIFMTYSGTARNVSTLAHELGHGFHQYFMNDLPQLTQRYAMNVAETASTFAEMIVVDASLKNAGTKQERIALLEDKLQRSATMFMNIHARFLFETQFYEERKKGMLSVDQLNGLMKNAQEIAYRGALDVYHPYFWASKQHFYTTSVPFYNFPYTFGFLFSSGIYARALQEGAGFEDQYIDLLRDTARMTVEDLAAKHLGVDLTKPDFWQGAVELSITDVDEFLRLTQ